MEGGPADVPAPVTAKLWRFGGSRHARS